MSEKSYRYHTRDWLSSRWKQEMDISKVKVGDTVEGKWFPEGYFRGKVEIISGELGFLTCDNTVALLKDAFSFRVVKP